MKLYMYTIYPVVYNQYIIATNVIKLNTYDDGS